MLLIDYNSQMKTKNILYFIGLLIIVIGVIWFILGDKEVNDVDTTQTVDIGGVSLDLPDGAVITPIPIETTIKAPELVREISLPDFYTEEAEKIMMAKIESAVADIEDGANLGEWLTLANLRSNIEDYGGAEEIYIYLNKVFPTNSISFVNLGNLYHLYIKDYLKAEENLKKAVENSPSNLHNIRSLYELYLYSYKQDTDLAKNTLITALELDPKNIDIMVLLADYYRDNEDGENAKSYYRQAINEAKDRGDLNLIYILEQEVGKIE